MIKVLIGNILESKFDTLVNTVNCVGVMGKGIAKEFKERYPNMYKDYVLRCSRKMVKPGEPYLYHDFLSGKNIINFPTKDHWRSASKMSFIINGLNWFVNNYEKYEIKEIAFPPLGCGNGGLLWQDVGPIMIDKLKDLPIDIEIYAPYGTIRENLSIQELQKKIKKHDKEIDGYHLSQYNKYWDFLLYIMQKLNQDSYSLHVGRTIYQKVCYVLTISGIPTGFQFSKKSFGPYSVEAKNALTILANNNLISERSNGQMIEINVDKAFIFNDKEFSKEEICKAERALDLLYRIKNTESAEIIASIIYAYRDLNHERNMVMESEIIDYLNEWKRRWANVEYDYRLKAAIVDLTEMGWIDPLISDQTFQEIDSYS